MPTSSAQNGRAGANGKPHALSRRIVFAFFIFIGLVVLLESPLTRIRHIDVAGNTSIDADAIVAKSGLHDGMSMWQVNADAVKHQVMDSEPLVQNVTVKSNWPRGTVSLVVEQKTVVAVLESGNAFYELLNDGTVYQKVSIAVAATLPLVQVKGLAKLQVGQVPSVDGLPVLCKQLTQVKTVKLQNVSQIVLDSYGSATVYFEDGFEADVKIESFASTLGQIPAVVQWFTSRGYGPGLIDMSGQEPYRYTPFHSAQGGNP